jgi:hypothetical protein
MLLVLDERSPYSIPRTRAAMIRCLRVVAVFPRAMIAPAAGTTAAPASAMLPASGAMPLERHT